MQDIYSQNPRLFTIKNAAGMSVTVMDWGATLISMKVPMPDGSMRETLLGLKNACDWKDQGCYFNATIGRYANRIANSNFTLGSKNYTLASNDRHTLHGGIDGFDKRRFEVIDVKDNALTLTLHSADGDQGFPGNYDLIVCYTLCDDNTLKVNYKGQCDAPCPSCITNHAYFNLNGYNSSILDHTLYLNSHSFLELDDSAIPTGKVLSADDNSAFDFRREKKIGLDFMNHAQMISARGYDHPYIREGESHEAFARATSGDGRLTMEVFTDYPAFQFYTGNYIHADNDIIARDDGKIYANQSGFCLEPEYYPDSVHLKQFEAQNPIVDPLHPLEKFIAYRFIAN